MASKKPRKSRGKDKAPAEPQAQQVAPEVQPPDETRLTWLRCPDEPPQEGSNGHDSDYNVWRTECGRYRVVRSVSTLVSGWMLNCFMAVEHGHNGEGNIKFGGRRLNDAVFACEKRHCERHKLVSLTSNRDIIVAAAQRELLATLPTHESIRDDQETETMARKSKAYESESVNGTPAAVKALEWVQTGKTWQAESEGSVYMLKPKKKEGIYALMLNGGAMADFKSGTEEECKVRANKEAFGDQKAPVTPPKVTKEKKVKEPREPKAPKELKEKNLFGSRLGTNNAAIGAALTEEPQSPKEIAALCPGVQVIQCKNYCMQITAKGLILRTEDGKFHLKPSEKPEEEKKVKTKKPKAKKEKAEAAA